jgi:Lrp/AsnC family transcriptional regulator, leucine-responsive regulatory protein
VNRFRACEEYATFYAETLRSQADGTMSLHKSSEIDSFDEKILQALQWDARKTSLELAEVVGLSPSSCQRRQRDLEQRGIIRGYRAEIDPAVLGRSFTVFAAVQLERHVRSDVQAFQKAVTQLPGILEVHHIAGAFDYLLRVAVADLASYEIFHADRLTALPGVAHITSYVVMSTLK